MSRKSWYACCKFERFDKTAPQLYAHNAPLRRCRLCSRMSGTRNVLRSVVSSHLRFLFCPVFMTITLCLVLTDDAVIVFYINIKYSKIKFVDEVDDDNDDDN